MLGDISFKLETKIMNFMSVFIYNVIKTTQVVMSCNVAQAVAAFGRYISFS